MNAHHAYGVRMGLAAETGEAIRRGVRPTNLPKDEQAVYDFADEFLRTHTVSDATLNAARTVLGGDRGIVDDGGAGQDAAACRRQAVFPVADILKAVVSALRSLSDCSAAASVALIQSNRLTLLDGVIANDASSAIRS